MALRENDKEKLEDFFKETENLRSCYSQSFFSYFAFRRDDKFWLCQGRLLLSWKPINNSFSHFQSLSIRAGTSPDADKLYKEAQESLQPRDDLSLRILNPNNIPPTAWQ